MTQEQHNAAISRIRDLAVKIDRLRQQKGEDLSREPATEEAERYLADPELNRAMMAVRINRMLEEGFNLWMLPDPDPGYEDFQAPSLEDEEIPWAE